MAAVVRLKRHLDDEPLGALILNCKKRKRSTNDSESEISTVLKFAGTLTTQTDDISSHISKLTKEDLEKSYKKHVPNLTSKIRQQRKEAAENSRFKVVNFFRSIDNEINSLEYKPSTDEDKLALTVLDVEAEIHANGEQNATDESDYVYDLYYTNSEGIDDSEFDSDFRVCPANEIILDTYEDGIGMASDHDSDDSNDENNWRNDYPDEEDDDDDEQDDDTVDENDMRKAMDCLSLNGDTLSSDDGEEGFSYSIGSQPAGCEDGLDHCDGQRYGALYARFKAKQKKEEEKYNKDVYHDEIDDTDDDFYD